MAKSNPNHRAFFSTFFEGSEPDSYAERCVNGWWLTRHWDGNKSMFVIDVYSPESYANYRRGKAQWKEQQEKMDFLKSI